MVKAQGNIYHVNAHRWTWGGGGGREGGVHIQILY